jgi:hypothetical protein
LLSVGSVEGLAIRQESRVRAALGEAFTAYERDYVTRARHRAHIGAAPRA